MRHYGPVAMLRVPLTAALLAALSLTVGLLAAPAALADEHTASSGQVTATFS